MSFSARSRRVLGYFLIATSFWGCQKADDPKAASSGKSNQIDWVGFKEPEYTKLFAAELMKPLIADYEQAADEIEALLDERKHYHKETEYAFPSGPDIHLYCEWQPAYETYRYRDLDHYRDSTTDQGDAKEAGEEFLDSYIHAQCGCCGHCDKPILNNQQLLDLCEKAIAAGSKDPTIQVGHAGLLWSLGKNEEALKEMDQLAVNFEEQNIAPVYSFLFRQWHYSLSYRQQANQLAIRARLVRYLEALTNLFKEMNADEDLRKVWSLCSDNLRSMNGLTLEDLLGAMMGHTEIPLFCKHYVAGMYCEWKAWEYRGESFAYKVPPHGWQPFHEYSDQAVNHFQRAWQLNPELPIAPERLIHLAMSGHVTPGWTDRDWFQEAIGAQFDYGSAYASMYYSLTPRWGGSHQQILDLARECVETERWETVVPAKALLGFDYVKDEIAQSVRFGTYLDEAEITAMLVEGQLSAIKNEEPFNNLTYNQSMSIVRILDAAEDYETAQRYLETYKGFVTQAEWAKDGTYGSPKRLLGKVMGLAGPEKEKIRRLEELVEPFLTDASSEAKLEEITELIDEIRPNDPRDFVQIYLDHLSELVRWQEDYRTGEWVNLTFRREMPGWNVCSRSVKIENENKILVEGTSDIPRPLLQCLSTFELPLVVEATIEITETAKSTYRMAFFDQIGILSGVLGYGYGFGQQRCQFGINTTRKYALHKNTYSSDDRTYMMSSVVGPQYRFHIELWPDRALVSANDQPIYSLRGLAIHPADLFSFGLLRDGMPHQTSFELSDVRVRKQPESYANQHLAFAKIQSEKFPSYDQYQANYGTALFSVGNYEQSLAQFDRALEIQPDTINYEKFRVQVLEKLGRFEDAIQSYQQIVNVLPVDANDLNSYAWLLATCPDDQLRNADRAVEFSKQLCEGTNYREWSYLDTLAVAYAEQGDFRLAKRTIERAISVAPQDQSEMLDRRWEWFDEEKTYLEANENSEKETGSKTAPNPGQHETAQHGNASPQYS